MDYGLTELQEEIRSLARRVAEEKVLPERARLDEAEEYPHEIMKSLAKADLMGVYIPEDYGGLGGGCLDLCLAVEELSRVCGAVAVCFAANALGAYPFLLHGSQEQKKKYLPKLASGEMFAAFGLTEPNAGSDAGAIQTTAIPDGDCYVLNGTKQWITNAGVAGVYTIIANCRPERGPRGISAIIVEAGAPGFTVGAKEKKLGIRASATCELHFDNCRVPKENLILKEGMGFRVTMETLNKSRPGIGAQAVGIAQGALEQALEFSTQRIQFGQPVSSFQAVQHMLADMATQIEAARLLVHHAARASDAGDPQAPKLAAMAKVFASDVAMKAAVDGIQICGGAGYMRDYPMEKYMRDAKITQIYEGTNQIQRNVIGIDLVKEFNQRKKKK
ncbi:MAG: acyl-CoA dehydrogenase family protein [Candidatus Sumerlaeota bacterium]|nr:acyl-CoA dehydrogenase family protein [Candidatus Sumerlaeota bacterium]